jgi:hypothetical protein
LQAILAQPKNAQAMFEMALLEEATGNTDEAINWLEKRTR